MRRASAGSRGGHAPATERPGPRDDGKVRPIENRRIVFPAFDVGEGVRADDEEQFRRARSRGL